MSDLITKENVLSPMKGLFQGDRGRGACMCNREGNTPSEPFHFRTTETHGHKKQSSVRFRQVKEVSCLFVLNLLVYMQL